MLLTVSLLFASCASFAQNDQVLNDLTDTIEFYNNEEILFILDGEIYTDASENGNIIIKTYSEDGNLIEEVTVDKESNVMESIRYNNDEMSLRSAPLVERIYLDEYKVEEMKDYQITPFAGRYDLGRTTYRSTTEPYYRAMSVSYTTYEDRVSYDVPTTMNTVGKLVAFIAGFISMPTSIAGKVVSGLISAGVISKAADILFFDKFMVSAKRTDSEFWGEDSNYKGGVTGTLYEVETRSSKYYGEKFKEGIYLDSSDWGNGTISRALGPSVYRGFYSELTYVSEGR